MTIQVIALLLFSLSVKANTLIESRIHDVDYGIRPHEDTLVLLENGRVIRIKDKEKNFLLGRSSPLSFSIDKNNYLLSVAENDSALEREVSTLDVPLFQPTAVEGLKLAEQYFKEMRRARNESECFNRAHVWSFELWKKHQVESQKIFIFFSTKYIREHDFEWWFHVAPMILVIEDSKLVERVMDRSFNKGPREVVDWKSTFIGKEIQCASGSKYSDYADYPYTTECTILKAPMYIHQPLDLEMLEVWNTQKPEFTLLDLKTAYKNGFDIKYNGGI